MQAADQAGVIGIETDRHQIDLVALGLEDDVGARDRDLADPALAKAAADHDALGIGPGLGLEKAPGDIGQFLGEFLDRAVHQRRRHDIFADQRLVELALGDVPGGLLAERVVAVLLQRLAQGLQDFSEGALAGAVADKALIVLQFDIEAVDVYRRQTRGAVTGDARGGCDFVSHLAPCPVKTAVTTSGEPIGFIGPVAIWLFGPDQTRSKGRKHQKYARFSPILASFALTWRARTL